MRTVWTSDRVITRWLREIGDSRFAFIQTSEATYERAAVVDESDKNLTVEFPKSTGNKDKPWKIVRNIIPKQQLISVQYYVE